MTKPNRGTHVIPPLYVITAVLENVCKVAETPPPSHCTYCSQLLMSFFLMGDCSYVWCQLLPHLFHLQKRKLSDGEAHVVSPTSPGVKFNKFKQPLSSPTALYADTPSPSTPTLAGYSAGSTFFAKTISAGEQCRYIVLCWG